MDVRIDPGYFFTAGAADQDVADAGVDSWTGRQCSATAAAFVGPPQPSSLARSRAESATANLGTPPGAAPVAEGPLRIARPRNPRRESAPLQSTSLRTVERSSGEASSSWVASPVSPPSSYIALGIAAPRQWAPSESPPTPQAYVGGGGDNGGGGDGGPTAVGVTAAGVPMYDLRNVVIQPPPLSSPPPDPHRARRRAGSMRPDDYDASAAAVGGGGGSSGGGGSGASSNFGSPPGLSPAAAAHAMPDFGGRVYGAPPPPPQVATWAHRTASPTMAALPPPYPAIVARQVAPGQAPGGADGAGPGYPRTQLLPPLAPVPPPVTMYEGSTTFDIDRLIIGSWTRRRALAGDLCCRIDGHLQQMSWEMLERPYRCKISFAFSSISMIDLHIVLNAQATCTVQLVTEPTFFLQTVTSDGGSSPWARTVLTTAKRSSAADGN